MEISFIITVHVRSSRKYIEFCYLTWCAFLSCAFCRLTVNACSARTVRLLDLCFVLIPKRVKYLMVFADTCTYILNIIFLDVVSLSFQLSLLFTVVHLHLNFRTNMDVYVTFAILLMWVIFSYWKGLPSHVTRLRVCVVHLEVFSAWLRFNAYCCDKSTRVLVQ